MLAAAADEHLFLFLSIAVRMATSKCLSLSPMVDSKIATYLSLISYAWFLACIKKLFNLLLKTRPLFCQIARGGK